MPKFRRVPLTTEMVFRVFADSLMVSFGYGAAVMTRFVAAIASEGVTRRDLWRYEDLFERGLWVLLPLAIANFAAAGFYTRGRGYAGRYKALIIVEAVSLAFLMFGFASFLMPKQLGLSRPVVFLAWGYTLCAVGLSRLWTFIWRRVSAVPRVPVKPRRDNKRVLVIGGAGYVGSALLPKLLARGFKVRLLDMMLFGDEPIAQCAGHPNLEIIRADFRQIDKLVEATQDVDVVVHLGGLVGDPACALDERLTLEINLVATRMIAEVAKGSGVSRLVFASTCSVYGASDLVLTERSQLNPVSLYARSKIASERVLQKLQDDAFSVTILRFGTIFGLSGRTRFDLVVNLLSAKAVVEGKITVFGGDQWRPFLHVDDAALSVLKAVEAAPALVHNETFNVGSNEQNMTLGQVGEAINRAVPTAQLIDSGMDGDRRNYRVDFQKIRDVLDYQPKWTVSDGIDQVIAAIRSGKIADYKAPQYSNLRALTEDTSADGVRQYFGGWESPLIEKAHLSEEQRHRDSELAAGVAVPST